MGRSASTISREVKRNGGRGQYRAERRAFRKARRPKVAKLSELTAFEFKRFLAEFQGRGLSPNTVHGFFEVIKAFGNWALREGWEVGPALLRVLGPKVPVTEMETYSEAQLDSARAPMSQYPAG